MLLQSPLGRQLLARLAQRGGSASPSTIPPSLSCRRHHNVASSRLSSCLSSCLSVPPSWARPSSLRIPTPPRRLPPRQARGYLTTQHDAAPQPNPQPKRRRLRGALFFLLFGALLATPFYYQLRRVQPWPVIEKDSALDRHQRARIHDQAKELPLLQDLLASAAWSAHHHPAYAAFEPADRPHRLTTGPLGTADGLGGFQYVFHHRDTGEVLTIVYLGTALSGWPQVAHGGVLATLLDEQCARAAMDDAAFAGTGPDRKGIVTARLELNYRKPTRAERFYVVRARAVPEAALDEADKGKRGRKVWVRTSLETIDGETCVEGRALYVKPAGTTLRAVGEDF